MAREVKKLTWREFLAEFEPKVHKMLTESRGVDGCDGMVVMRCEVFDSSRFGEKTAMRYGPDCTFKTLEDTTKSPGGIYPTGLPSSAAFVYAYTTDKPE